MATTMSAHNCPVKLSSGPSPVVIRSIMRMTLSSDHRIVDGRESVTFLKRVKEAVEDPRRLLLGL